MTRRVLCRGWFICKVTAQNAEEVYSDVTGAESPRRANRPHCDGKHRLRVRSCANLLLLAGNCRQVATKANGGLEAGADYNMNTPHSLELQLRYGRELLKSGVAGLNDGREAHLHGRPLSDVLSESARASLGLATLGACAGLLRYYLPARRGRLVQTLACGLLGGAFGFLAGFGWQTRELAESMTRSAAKEMGTVRDQHWLDQHPIDYA